MFHTSFDDLESSLDNTIQAIKRQELIKEAGIARGKERLQTELRLQLEDQAYLLNRIKNHHREIRQSPQWPALEEKAKKLLNIHTLFSPEEKEQYAQFKIAVNKLITEKLCEIDASVNERILEHGFEKADRSKQVKIYKNWTSI